MVYTYINMLNVNQLWPRTPTTQIRSLKVCFKWKISTRIYGVRLVKFNKLLIPNIGAASHQLKTCNLMYTRITQAHITGISFTLFMRNPIFFPSHCWFILLKQQLTDFSFSIEKTMQKYFFSHVPPPLLKTYYRCTSHWFVCPLNR